METNEITLSNLYAGGLEEIFNKTVSDVIANIQDPNTEPQAVREINIKIAFKPNANRDAVTYSAEVKSKLVGIAPVGSTLFIHDNKFLERNLNQGDLFESEKKIKELKHD
jgi:hypothetical protein